ncbi:MAG: hypothetical protein GQ570_11765 [Helicobacteraceae bacterium]|nr:hypothetical protein [Helicobacteraceae bacterium]
MGINLTNVQGLTATLAAVGTSVLDATEIATAISGGKAINCLQTLGDITSSRSVKEYACMSSDEIAKSLGALTLGNLQMDLLFDSTDLAGQQDLIAMYADNSKRVLIIALNDDPTGTTHNPTYITFDVAVSSQPISLEKDSAVMIKNTVEICSKPDLTLAAFTV